MPFSLLFFIFSSLFFYSINHLSVHHSIFWASTFWRSKPRPRNEIQEIEGWPCTRESNSEFNRESLNFQHSLCLYFGFKIPFLGIIIWYLLYAISIFSFLFCEYLSVIWILPLGLPFGCHFFWEFRSTKRMTESVDQACDSISYSSGFQILFLD